MQSKFKTLARYVAPSVAAMLVNFLYVVVDGIFVGQGVGTGALAAVNIAIPFTSLVIALASMVVMGGASVTAIRIGRGDTEGANHAFMSSVEIVLAISAFMMLIGVIFPRQVAAVSGASPALMQDTADYIRYYCLFAVVNSLAICGSNFVRNDGRPTLAFVGMVAGALANVFLDWLFVFPLGMGIKGAAIASGLGQVLSLGILASHFIRKKGALRIRFVALQKTLVAKIFGRGLPELVTQLGQPITTLCYNYVILRVMGEIGVAAYSVIGYLLTLILGVFLGVSQGIQPLIGNSFGSKDKGSERFYLRSGMVLNIGLSALIYLVLLLGGANIIAIFNSNAQMISIAYQAIQVYGLSFVVASVNIILTTYYFSTKRTKQAVIIAASRGLSLNILFILVLPLLFGASVLWYAPLFAELSAMVIGISMLYYDKKHTVTSLKPQVTAVQKTA